MARVNRLLAVVLLVATSAVFAVAGDAVFLGYGFEEGHSQQYSVKFNQELDFGGFAMSQIIDMEVTEKCSGVEDSLFLMELLFDKVEAARMQFDNMVDDPMGENLTGHSVTFKVDRHGETNEIRPTGYIEGWEQMAKIVESLVENWYAYLPNEAIAEGGGWSKEDEPEQEGGMKFSGKANYVFKETKKEKGRECAKIVADTENSVSGTQETPAGTMAVTGGGKGDIEFYFCMKSSTIVKYKAKVEMKMDMTPESGGSATETTVIVAMERQVK